MTESFLFSLLVIHISKLRIFVFLVECICGRFKQKLYKKHDKGTKMIIFVTTPRYCRGQYNTVCVRDLFSARSEMPLGVPIELVEQSHPEIYALVGTGI